MPSISLSSSSALAEEDEEDFDDENVDTFKVDVEESALCPWMNSNIHFSSQIAFLVEMPKTARREKSEVRPDSNIFSWPT